MHVLQANAITHDQRALDAAVRRFGRMLGVCRDSGIRDPVIVTMILSQRSQIVAEYRRVVGQQ